MTLGAAGRISAVLAVAAGSLLAGGQAARAGYQTVDMAGVVNVPFSGEINGSTFPTGAHTFNGVPFSIANVSNGNGGYNNFWTGGGSTTAASGTYSVTLSLPDVMDVTHVYTMINTLWGSVGTKNVLDITFSAGNGGASVTQDLIDGTNVRDYNLEYGNTINGTTTKQAFSNGEGQVLDMQEYTLPSYFATDGLVSVTLTEDGASGYEKAMFNALTLQTGAPLGVAEPVSLSLLLTGAAGLAAVRRRRC
jgi:hypothetical protein